MKKRIFVLLITLALVLPYLFSTMSFAATDVTFSIGSRNAKRGDTITVTVNMNCTTNFNAANFTLTYNTSVLEYVPYLDGNNEVDYTQNCGSTIMNSGTPTATVVINSNTAGTIKVGYMSTNSVAGKSGEFLKFKFNVKSNATYGNSNITFNATTLKSSNGNNLNATYNNGVLSILQGITMNKATTTIAEGGTDQLSVSSSNGTIFDTVSWVSSNSNIATVATGSDTKIATVTAVAPGSATITATLGNVSANCTVTVSSSYTISIKTPTWTLLPISQIRTLTVLFNPSSSGTGKTVTWSSSQTNVATINSATGQVTAVGAGTTTITATVENKSATYTLTVAGSLGDVDGDNTITSYDAYRALILAAMQHAGELLNQSELDQVVVLDVERDGSMSSNDAYKILKYSVGLISSF